MLQALHSLEEALVAWQRAGEASPVALVTTWEARCGELWSIHGGGLNTSRAECCSGSWIWALLDDSLRPHTVSPPLGGPSLCPGHMLLCGIWNVFLCLPIYGNMSAVFTPRSLKSFLN